MNQVPVHTCGQIDGIVFYIDGFAYALVEDGILPLEMRISKDRSKSLSVVLFGGQWYHLRDKGTATHSTNGLNSQIRLYSDNEGRILQNNVQKLEHLIAAFVKVQAGAPTPEPIAKDPDSVKHVEMVAKNSIEDEKGEACSKKNSSASSELHFAADEVMPYSKVISILKEVITCPNVCTHLFGSPKFELKKKPLRCCPRTSTFWWVMVDIALALASSKLLNWVISTCRLWDEELGPYFPLPNDVNLVGIKLCWVNPTDIEEGILNRFIHWWESPTMSEANDRGERDENNVYGDYRDRMIKLSLSYREQNIIPFLKSLYRVKEHVSEVDKAFVLDRCLKNMLECQWPCSAIEYILLHLDRESCLGTSIPDRYFTTFASASTDRLIFAIKKFRFLPLVSDIVRELFDRISSYELMSTRILPLIKTLASLASPGWCKILKDENSASDISHRNKSGTPSKPPVLIFEDTVHQYDPKALKPAPPIFDFEMFSAVLAESCLFTLLRNVEIVDDPSSIILVMKQIIGCGTSLRNTNLKGKLASSQLSSYTSLDLEIRAWLKKQDAYTPNYSTLYITKDTSSKKRPPNNIVVPERKKETNNGLFKLPEPICSDSLKYALIAGDIAKAKEEFENGAHIRVIVDGRHQTFAYWELMYEIVRQGRLESLKLLHERGFPLKDVLLRRHLFPTRIVTRDNYEYNETDDDWPYEDAGDIHYRLIIEACKVGNLEMVRFLREVAKSSWSSNSRSEYHYPTFWYTIRMDEELSKARKGETKSEEISSVSNSSSSSSNDPSTSSSSSNNSSSSNSTQLDLSSIGPTPAMDYFESQLLSHNMSDPMTDMPFSIYAAVKGSLNALKWMESRGWNIIEDSYRGGTIAHYALCAGHYDIIDWLSTKYDNQFEILTQVCYDSMTALDWALARKVPKSTLLLDSVARSRLIELQSKQKEQNQGSRYLSVESGWHLMPEFSNCVPIDLEKIEWCDAPPMSLMPPISESDPSKGYSSYDRHDFMMVDMGLTDTTPFLSLNPGDLKNLQIAEAYEHLRGPIEDFLTYRDTVLINMREENHNIKRVERWAKQEKSFSERHAKSPIPSYLVVSDFVRRISVQSNFEVDFWNAWCTGSHPDRESDGDNVFQNFLLLSQFAGVDMKCASVDAYKRDWLRYEPCIKGAIAPLLELAGEDPGLAGLWQFYPHPPGVKRRQTSIFVVVARAAPWVGRFRMTTGREDGDALQGWGSLRPRSDQAVKGICHVPEHEDILKQTEFSPLIWMFTVLLPTARRIVAIASEVFIEVALTGSIPMLEWLIDNCDIGDKTMDCYRMMMCQVATFGALNTLKWLHHRGFPLSFTPDDSGLTLEASTRFETSEYMPRIPIVLLSDLQERASLKKEHTCISGLSKPYQQPQIIIRVSRRPNFINAVIALYPCLNYVCKKGDAAFAERIDFLVKNGVSLFEADTLPNGVEWDASDYIQICEFSFLVEHLKNGPFKADVSYKPKE